VSEYHRERVSNETAESKELTDKIHRLVRSFSKQLVSLVYQELGARKVHLKSKPGPLPGYKLPKRNCPLCKGNANTRKRFGYICKDCSAGKPIGWKTKLKEVWPEHRKKNRDTAGKDFEVVVPIPKHIPVKPQSVEVEDAEPSFLDQLVEIVTEEKVPPKNEKAVNASSDDVEFFS
jgi:hypothetical protein